MSIIAEHVSDLGDSVFQLCSEELFVHLSSEFLGLRPKTASDRVPCVVPCVEEDSAIVPGLTDVSVVLPVSFAQDHAVRHRRVATDRRRHVVRGVVGDLLSQIGSWVPGGEGLVQMSCGQRRLRCVGGHRRGFVGRSKHRCGPDWSRTLGPRKIEAKLSADDR